ncbi:toll/interleukin-1 receptor domain-containing protein [Hellea balneolensis]|uniref:toll/interleukin-1 receptor domain-containing protein n=1 Tax=Hellea balneolensis TaxID=287478 RepID=UPI00040D6FBE|nr:toll/interleukin-1 receptor domain-containing protein [Hellea balneolensis]
MLSFSIAATIDITKYLHISLELGANISDFTYRVFISYSHKDRTWGKWLHQALEKYRIPKHLLDEESPAQRFGRCFREDEELGALAEIGPKIKSALHTSDALVAICSINSAQSNWVNEEITEFKASGRAHRVFALIVDGEPHGGMHECFPDALKKQFDATGNFTGKFTEPLAIDVRKFGRDDAKLKLISGVLDCEYDAIKQREVLRQKSVRRRSQALFAGGIALSTIAIIGIWQAIVGNIQTRETRSTVYAQAANRLNEDRRHADAMIMALIADPSAQATLFDRISGKSEYINARDELIAAVTHNRLRGQWNNPNATNGLVSSRDGFFVTGHNNTVRLWEIGSAEPKREWSGPWGGVRSLAISRDGSTIFGGSYSGKIIMIPVKGGNPEVLDSTRPSPIVAAHPTKDLIAIGTGDSELFLMDYSGNKIQELSPQIKGLIGMSSRVDGLVFDTHGSWLIANIGTSVFGINLQNGERREFADHSGVSRNKIVVNDLSLRDNNLIVARVNSVEEGQFLKFTTERDSSNSKRYYAAAQSNDASIYAFATNDGQIHIGSSNSPMIAYRFLELNGKHVEAHVNLDFLDSSSFLLSGYNTDYNNVKLWDVREPIPEPVLSKESLRLADELEHEHKYFVRAYDLPDAAKLYRANSNIVLQKFGAGHWGAVEKAAFISDTTNVVTQFYDDIPNSWRIHPFIFLSVKEQVSVACDQLRAMNQSKFEENAINEFPFLSLDTTGREVVDPCKHILPPVTDWRSWPESAGPWAFNAKTVQQKHYPDISRNWVK